MGQLKACELLGNTSLREWSGVSRGRGRGRGGWKGRQRLGESESMQGTILEGVDEEAVAQ